MSKKILVLCTGNSCRSQIAHGFLAAQLSDEWQVYSAGLEAHGVNPRAIQVMAEAGIDISNHTSNIIADHDQEQFDLVLTVCDHAKEMCPLLPGVHHSLHHSFPDPAQATGTEEEIMTSFRSVRDEIRDYCQELVMKIESGDLDVS